jgi:hypothetical protein
MITFQKWANAVEAVNSLIDDEIELGKDYHWEWDHTRSKMGMKFKVVDIETMVLLKYQHLINGT